MPPFWGGEDNTNVLPHFPCQIKGGRGLSPARQYLEHSHSPRAVVYSQGVYAKNHENEVMIIRKAISFVLSVIIAGAILLPATNVSAANASSAAGAVTVSSGRLNVRESATSASAVVSSLKKGSYITLMWKTGSWWYVEYGDDKYGYCYADYITPVEGTPAAVRTQGGNLNVRSGAGTAYAKTGSLPGGEYVLVLSSAGGWSRVLYNGTKTGYVSSAYLSTSSSSSSSQGYSAVKLSVPSYKQTDSRWANVTLGSSGKTMARIGCATTAIAMVESYRTGTTVYPNTMASRLKYTSSGSVYWPEHYTPVTGSSGYLSGIYSLLKQGKPVLFGAKNAYGSQHWVVVTGFTGGSLTASAFTVNDPGSNSRVTLGQFLSAYPNFYKYFKY